MAHNLAEINGRINLALRGKPAWHALGTIITDPSAPGMDYLTAADLHHEVILDPIFTADGMRHDEFFLTRYQGLNRPGMGIVSKDYKPFQNSEAVRFVETLAQGREIEWEAVGALGNGSRVWFLCKVPGALEKIGFDKIDPYILLVNNHNGKGCFRGLLTTTRVVCQNTLNMALSGKEADGFAIRHRGKLADYVADAARILGLAMRGFDSFADQVITLQAFKPSANQVKQFLNHLYGGETTNAENTRNTIEYLSRKGVGNDSPDVAGTGWGWLNGVTEYVDHVRSNMTPVKTQAAQLERRANRLDSNWFGTGAQVKQDAMVALLTLASGKDLEAPEKKSRIAKGGGVLIN